jgi:hypothetical protein
MDTAFMGLTSSHQITTIGAGYYSGEPVLKRDIHWADAAAVRKQDGAPSNPNGKSAVPRVRRNSFPPKESDVRPQVTAGPLDLLRNLSTAILTWNIRST